MPACRNRCRGNSRWAIGSGGCKRRRYGWWPAVMPMGQTMPTAPSGSRRLAGQPGRWWRRWRRRPLRAAPWMPWPLRSCCGACCLPRRCATRSPRPARWSSGALGRPVPTMLNSSSSVVSTKAVGRRPWRRIHGSTAPCGARQGCRCPNTCWAWRPMTCNRPLPRPRCG